MSYAAKVMTAGVFFKAVFISALVTILGATNFTQSIILVVVSGCVTGVFGLLIVLIQVNSEKHLHERVDQVEMKIDTKTQEITTKTEEAAAQAAEQITQAVTENK